MFSNKTIHLIGIGGVSMSGIAEMLLSMGAIVTGSDVAESKITKHLESLGITIFYGHHPELIKDADIIVYSAAIHEDDPERLEVARLKKENYERAPFLGKLMLQYKNSLCISGTHGKSTTTGMVASIFLEAELNPTIQIGAILPSIHSTSRIGAHDYLIMEACEYVDSFLHFKPTAEIITNIDNDHLDYFKNLDNIKSSFQKYANLLPNNGYLILNEDDENSKCITKTDAKIITYGLQSDANFIAKNIEINEYGCYSFDVYHDHVYYIHINLELHGKHNIYNALAAIALASNYIYDKDSIRKGIEAYHGVERRFEFITEFKGARIYDDYAHHPTELQTIVNNLKDMKYHKSIAVFQPHTYSRTIEHLDQFADTLKDFDEVIIAKIYAAREENVYGVKEIDLVDKINANGDCLKARFIEKEEDIISYLKENIEKGDFVITIGAGPINKIAYQLKEKN